MVNTNMEPREAVVGFIKDSLGELFIYPSIICGLFGFINERGWEFDSALAVFDFILLSYSFLTVHSMQDNPYLESCTSC